MKLYKILCVITSAAFIYSFVQHLFNSGAIKDMGLETSVATYVLARRMSIFPLGLAILLLLSRNLGHSKARQHICLSTGLVLTGYACIGVHEMAMGNVNFGMLIPVGLEIVLGGLFLMIFAKNRKAEPEK